MTDMFLRSCWTLTLFAAGQTAALGTPAWVEYSGHPASYGDHAVSAIRSGGPAATLQVEFSSDESILHGDGVGQSQRTARNTLTFATPSDASNPQEFDVPDLIANYGGRFPQLQQLSANGTSVLTFRFPEPVTAGFDLFVTDVDTNDSARVSARAPGGVEVDMTTWRLVDAGDLSTYKNTGTGFSAITAPEPLTTFSLNEIRLDAVDGTNYNRSYSILRAPANAPVESVSISFTGTQNSPSRALGGNGSHIYLAMVSLEVGADFNRDGTVDGADLAQWKEGYGMGRFQVQGDATGDGVADGADFLAWQRQKIRPWSRSISGSMEKALRPMRAEPTIAR